MLASNVDLPRHPDVRYVDAPTAADLRAAALDAFGACDVAGDGRGGRRLRARRRPARARSTRAPRAAWRSSSSRRPTSSPSWPRAATRQVLVGFAAEHGAEGLARARAKRERKRLDLIVHNDVSVEGVGFGSGDNEITIIGAGRRGARCRA